MLSLLLPMAGALQYGLDCDLSSSSVIELKWDMFATETGLYTVVGCEGLSPTLQLNIQQEYKFLQQHSSNWYHPIGFTYEPVVSHSGNHAHSARMAGMDGMSGMDGEMDGMHGMNSTEMHGVDGMNSTNIQMGGSWLTGDAVQYYMNGQAVMDDMSGFGMDPYVSFFSYPKSVWEASCGGGGCFATLNIPNADVNTIFYTCHVHTTMIGKIVLKGAEAGASPMMLDQFPQAPTISAFDEACGTWDSEPYTVGGTKAELCHNKHFLCGEDQQSDFNTCLAAIDCQMHDEMAVSTSPNRWATFIRQMIPHHLNAVQMAKLILKKATFEEDGNGDVQGFEALTSMAHAIVNSQNAQITTMRGWLETYEAASNTHTERCYEKCSHDGMHMDMRSRLLLFGSQPHSSDC